MNERHDAKALAEAVLNGDQDFDAALEELLTDDLSLEDAHAALCYFKLGQSEKAIVLSKGSVKVEKIIRVLGLEPFAPLVNDQEPDRHGEVRHPVKTLVEFGSEVCRVIGRRKVTILALPSTDVFEVFLESADGKPMYFVGESMVEPVEGE